MAKLLTDHAARLQSVPAGYMVSDQSTIRLLNDAARALVEQDARLAEFTIAARGSTDQSMRRLLARKA
jgi:protein subunit release factor A